MNQVSPLLGLSQRLPPSNVAAEQAVLGALLANNLKAYERVADFLKPEHFADPVHVFLYREIARRSEAGRLADVVTLRQDLEHAGVLDDAGGPAYLAQLLSAMVGVINAGEYGRMVRDAWVRRQVIDLGEAAVNLAFGADPAMDADQVLEHVERGLFALGESAAGKEGDLADAAAVAQQVMARHRQAADAKGGIVGLATGYRDLDRMKGGLCGGELFIIGARPAMGKTALGAGIAARAARAGARVLFVSAEMAAWQIQARIVAAAAGLPLQAVLRAFVIEPGDNRGRGLNDIEAARFVKANGEVAALPIMWDARGRPSVASIRARARRLKARQGLDLIVVDYLGLLDPAVPSGQGNRNAELTAISAGLKGLAVELDVPVVALSQLSREVERRDDKRPVMSDLRDSGSLEQDADAIAFLYREHYYLSRGVPERREKETEEQFHARVDVWRTRLSDSAGRAELILAKHRQGATGTVPLRFDERRTWFMDEDEGRQP